ncbi:MAG: 50S ribosomal protein L18 [Planctomyces sp.]|nr:50S ribosomal protein L18 [Planctomyces sp.]MBA4119407.1 50S ribosomal protein L18 [Isosphaera sp.]
MDHAKHKRARRERRHVGIRKRVEGTPSRPRLAVYKSLMHIYAQVIDDLAGRTLVSASSLEADLGLGKKTGNAAAAAAVGAALAKRAKDKGVQAVVFDRAGFRYHGRVKALADAARKEGLQF